MDGRITAANVKLLGRTFSLNGTLWLSYSASGAEWEFFGTSCTVTLTGDFLSSDEIHSPRYAIEADGVRIIDTTLVESMKNTSAAAKCVKHIVIADTMPAHHVVRVIKLSESADSTLGIEGVMCDGEMHPTAASERKMEIIGDSITCGYGVDGALGEIYRTANEDATKGYAYLTAQMLKADYSLVSFSGYGIVSGYTETGVRRAECLVPPLYGTMGESYGAFADREKPREIPWDFTKFVPDVCVLNLGTNDASYCGEDPARRREYISGYKAFLSTVRACNPAAQLVCILGTMDTRLCDAMETAASEYREETGDSRVATLRMTLQDMEKDGAGVDWHPSAVTHKKAAAELTAFLRKLLGWD